MDENVTKLVPLLEKLSEQGKKSLIGAKTFNILKNYFGRIDALQMAQCMINLYGYNIFKKKSDLLRNYIFRMSRDELNNLVAELSLNATDYESVLKELNKDRYKKKFLESRGFGEEFMGVAVDDNRTDYIEVGPSFGSTITKSYGSPHYYQREVKIKIHDVVRNDVGSSRFLVVMPTGSGKTRTANEFLIDILRKSNRAKVLWVVDSNELLEQSLQSFVGLWIEKGDSLVRLSRIFDSFQGNQSSERIINYCGFDKLLAMRNSAMEKYLEVVGDSNYLIVDEAHYSLADKYNEILEDIHRENPKIVHIGLTATPLRGDDNEFRNLQGYYFNKILDMPSSAGSVDSDIERLQQEGYLANLEINYIRTSSSKINEEKKEFNELVITNIVHSIKNDSRIVVFSKSKHHAIALDILARNEGLASAVIVGETPQRKRVDIFNKFESNEIDVIFNYDILSTGIDLPSLNELFILRKFGNSSTAMQVVGRALRGELNGGNPCNKITSVVSNDEMLGNPARLYDKIKHLYQYV